jgi:hypothetical protein
MLLTEVMLQKNTLPCSPHKNFLTHTFVLITHAS